ncbi:MAG: formylglycine-generating enzyme family protein [Nitrospira sp.]
MPISPSAEPRGNSAASLAPGVGAAREARESSRALPDDAAIQRVNEQLRLLQREELQQLAQRGIVPPERMILIPGGEFLMGAEDGLPDARPMHRVYISRFWLDEYEVTNRQYRLCAEGGGCTFPKDRSAYDDTTRAEHPVTNVTWYQARGYCKWLGKRLPTEAGVGKSGARARWAALSLGKQRRGVQKHMRTVEQNPVKNGTEPVGTVDFTVSLRRGRSRHERLGMG